MRYAPWSVRITGSQYRLGALDYKPGGLDADAAVAAAQALIEAGVDSIHISGGVHGPQAQDWDGTSEGYHVDVAARVRAAVTVPVIVPGAIRTPAFADRVVRDGKADLVAVGTAMLDNPRWAADAIKALAGSSRSRIVPEPQRTRSRRRSDEAEPAQRSARGRGFRRDPARVIVPDLNLLIYAHNDRAPLHASARRWWEGFSRFPGLRWRNPL